MNRVFNEKFISKTISNLFKADIPITIDGKEYDNVSEGFYGVLEQSLIETAEEEGTLSEKEIEDFMEDTGLEDFITEKFSKGVEAIILGEDVAILTEDELSTGIIVDEIYNEENNPFAPMMESFRKFISTPMVIVGYVVVLLKVLKRKKQ